ncbi:S24/S26 family peptidase [Curtobacterium sp. MCBA15_012]|uniref:S24/S26 family peptidase n=1 Tax=Curtobacterium sp. MCBA15_012 TaxID=1898738 RepID=UPI0008DDB26F|nr:S24/S26 family peptidase [Curtobacterium sp. MCBA15_012]WIB00792.1 S24/S26 family peptidase [Curtobacterium sp. MCBA15_012]
MDSTGVGGQHRHARPDAVLEALDWTRVVVGTAARAIVATVVGLALWAAAPAVLGWQPTTVVTGSMAPRLTPGDVVVSRPVPEPDVVPGRVLLADDPDQPGHLRLHRYVEARDDGTLVTKGDANPAADSTPLDRSAVHGVGYLRVPWVGVPVAWAHEGRWGAVAGAAAVLAGLLALCAVDGGLRRAGREARGASAPPPPSGGTRVHGRRSARGPAVRDGSRAGARHAALRQGGALLVTVAVLGGVGLVAPDRAEAVPFAASTTSPPSRVTAAVMPGPTKVTCVSNGPGKGVTISWTKPNWAIRGYDVSWGGTRIASPDAAATSVVVTAGLLDITSGKITVRALDAGPGSVWSADGDAQPTVTVVTSLSLTCS